MTDNEEIEAAYVAIGKLLGYDKLGGYLYWWTDGLHYVIPGEVPKYFRWLNDDADAFRLAVDLNMEVAVETDSAQGSSGVTYNWPDGYTTSNGVSHADFTDKYAATRHVIVQMAQTIARDSWMHRK
jgi:hypothetical protein